MIKLILKKKQFRVLLVIIAILSFGLAACGIKDGQVVEADTPNTKLMMETIQKLTETPRPFGSKEIESARQFIFETLSGYGYEVLMQEFSARGQQGYNIIANKYPDSIQKTDDILIVSAHYDSVLNSPGANDNAGGVAVLLEIAKLLKDLPSDTEVRFISFDGEDQGRLGSYYYVNNLNKEDLSRIIGVINFDMLASEKVEGMKFSTYNNKHNFLSDMFSGFSFREGTWSMSDHISFVSTAIPTLSISHAADEYNHSLEDTINHIDENKLFIAAEEGAKVISNIISDETSSFIQKRELERNHIYKLNLVDLLPFGETREAVEEELGIMTTQFPVKPASSDEIALNCIAMIDWWGEPLETHFIYYYIFLSDINLVEIRIKLNETDEALNILNENFECIDMIDVMDELMDEYRHFPIINIDDNPYYPIDYKDIKEIWILKDNKRCFLVETLDNKELIILSSQ